MTDNRSQVSIITRADETFSNFLDIQEDITINTKVKGKFFLIKYTYDENREEAFIDFILDSIQYYALTQEEIDECRGIARKIIKKAYRRFVQRSRSGEFGEIILFHVLEVFQKAMQIVNKMSLKTSGNMHYHGADAVHFGLDGELKILYLGESKTGKQFSDILIKSLKSVENFYNTEKDRFEIDLVSGNLSKDIPEDIKGIIKNYIDPTQPDKENCCQINAIFLGFEESFLKNLETQYSGKELLKKVVEGYKERIETYIRSIEEKLSEHGELTSKSFYFFLLPFKDLDKIKAVFSEEIKK